MGRRDRVGAGARHDARRRALRRRAGGDRELRRPQVALLPRPCPGGRRPGGRGRRPRRSCATTNCGSLRRAGLVHGFGRLGISSNAILGQARGTAGRRRVERVRLQPYLTERMLRQSDRARAARGASPSSTASGSTGSGYPRGVAGAGDLPHGADPRRRGRLPGDARAAPAPAGALGGARRPPSCAPRSGPAASTPRRSRPCSAPPATACRAAARGRRASPPREVEVLRLARARACRTRRSPSGS